MALVVMTTNKNSRKRHYVEHYRCYYKPLQLLKATPFEVEVEMRHDFDTFEIRVKATRGPATRYEFVQIYKTKTIREFVQICKSKMFINDISRAKTLRSEIPKIYKT